MKSIKPNVLLRVIIRDDSPFMHMQEPPYKRVVTLQLTDEQIELLRLKWISKFGSTDYYENISDCFLEILPIEFAITQDQQQGINNDERLGN